MFTPFTPDEEWEYFTRSEDGSLHLAWNRLLSSTILDTKDRLGLKIFSARTSDHIDILIDDLLNDKYTPSEPYFMYGPKNSKMIRIRTFLDIRDRLVYQAIGNIIIENSYADIAQKANNTIFAHIPAPKRRDGTYSDFTFLRTFSTEFNLGQYEKFQKQVYLDQKRAHGLRDVWMLETDIASFYPSIDHNLIIEMLRRRQWLKNEKLLSVLKKCLRKWSELKSDAPMGQGVPIGYETSEYLATLFLLDIDLEMSIAPPIMRRFVDDTFAFFDGRDQLYGFLIEWDFALQKRGLIRNSGKTRIELCSDRETLDEAKSRRNLRSKTSYIKNVLNKPEQPSDEREDGDENNGEQLELQALLDDFINWTDECDLELEGQLIENAATAAFVLYRLKTLDEDVKHIALCVLDLLPSKSLHATRYLSLFEQDWGVYKNLLEAMRNFAGYTSVKIDCMNAAICVAGEITDDLTGILVEWINQSDDWYLRDAAIDFLSEHDFEDLTSVLPLGDSCHLVRAKALYRYFEIADIPIKIQLINRMFDDENYTIRALGIYLTRRETTTISRDLLKTSILPPQLENLVLTTEDLANLGLFVQQFEAVFDVEISLLQDLIRHIPDIKSVNQFLLNLLDSTSDPIDFLLALYEVFFKFLTGLAKFSNPQLNSNDVSEVLSELYENGDIFDVFKKLEFLCQRALEDDRKIASVQNKNAIFKKTKEIIAVEVYEIYNEMGLETPPKLDEYLHKDLGYDHNMRNQVFISYSRRDAEWLEKLQNYLKPYKLDVWTDQKIMAGEKWLEEINTAIQSARVAVLLVTQAFLSSNFIQSEELPKILEAAETEGVKILWISVKSSTFHKSPLRDYQCVNNPEQPLEAMETHELNKTLVEIADTIEAAMKN